MVIFNLGALIQAVIIGVLIFLLSKIGLQDFTDSLELSLNNKNIIKFYCFFLTLAISDKLGIKGRLFFIPTWILSLIVIFIHNFGNKNDIVNSPYNMYITYLNYVLPIVLGALTYVWIHKNRLNDQVNSGKSDLPLENFNKENS
ncbi:hypothetical protein [Elizabethkingia meningoseptica]|uniref:hypothetical protein n=1 Tax=Elizabethkingia meningoseptica TaxID=238 RepID=UPI003891DC50